MALDGRDTPDHPSPDSATAAVRHGRSAKAGLIGWLASRPASFRRMCLVVYWTCIFGLTHWPDVSDFPSAGWLPEHFDLVLHGCMYAGLTVAWWWVLTARGGAVAGRAAGKLLVGGMAYGAFDELSQVVVGRTSDVADWVADLAGILAALLLLRWWSRRQSHSV